MVCLTLKNCDIVTAYNFRGAIISVGISIHDGIKYITLCLADPVLGCQHINSRQAVGVILIERLARALMISDDLA